jgi:hypothetical protein
MLKDPSDAVTLIGPQHDPTVFVTGSEQGFVGGTPRVLPGLPEWAIDKTDVLSGYPRDAVRISSAIGLDFPLP